MASNPDITLKFEGDCRDCGLREVALPAVLPEIGDDFDWDLRDYDGFRLFILEELVGRFPERKRWTPADLEVVLVESLSAILDQLSDMLDRTASEAYLESARKPESVRRLLKLIGYDAVGLLQRQALAPFAEAPAPEDTRSAEEKLEQYWLDHPEKMDIARRDGPISIHTQRRIVTVEDYEIRLQEHPLVLRAKASLSWGGSWSLIRVAVIPWRRLDLDALGEYSDDVWAQLESFHNERDIFLAERSSLPSVRSVLRHFIEDYRMVGQEVLLDRAEEVGIQLFLSIQVNAHYFQSEVKREIARALGTSPGGFFEPGRLRFGEDLWAGDIFELLMALDGVDNVCLNRFKRIGDRFADESDSGRIALEGLEVAVCDNSPDEPERGYYYLQMNGGRRG